MKKAALPTSQSFQHRAFTLAPTKKVLPPTKLVRSATPSLAPKKVVAAPKLPHADASSTPPDEPPMAADISTGPVVDMSLATAVASNNIDAVKALLKSGVDLRPANWYDTPVLVSAAAQGFVEIVQQLIAARANVNSGYEALPLTSAAEHGHLSTVRLLLAAGAYLNAKDARGRTAVMAAAATGQLTVVKFLVEAGAPLTTATQGETALSLAAKGGHQSVYAFLQQKMAPTAMVQPPTVDPQQQPGMSVMDEMIAHGAAELNELLANSVSERPVSANSVSANSASENL